MITPNKAIPLEASVLSRLGAILDAPPEIGIVELYHMLAHRFESIDQFILALDTLYVLGKINIDLTRRMVTSVAKD